MKPVGNSLFFLLLAVAAAFAADPSWRRETAVMDSLHVVQPELRLEWLRKRGLSDLLERATTPDSQGLHVRGKWGRGPAVEVTGRDSLVVLTLGSEVALLDFAQPDSPQVLSEIQFDALTNQSCLLDSLLIVGSNSGIEFWNVANTAQPVRRSRLPYPVGDFWVQDTFLYFIRQDTFRAYSFADAASPRLLGWYRDSGYVTTGSGNTVIIGNGSSILLADVSNPANPHRISSYAVGGYLLSACARGNLCCVSFESTTYPYPVSFATLDISNPASVLQLGRLNNAGGYDICLDSTLAFVSGRDQSKEPFQILSIADSVHPALVDTCRTTEQYNWGVWASLRLDRALVADDYDGLAVVNISTPSNPLLESHVMVAATAEDVAVDGRYCYVADGMAGMKILDLLNPSSPVQVGEVDTSYVGAWSYAVAARNGIAYLSWYYPYFRTYDVSNPTQPELLGACFPPDQEPRDIVVRDTLAYSVIDYAFYVINIARPRQPQVVGTCNMTAGYYWGMKLQDTLAYLGSWDGLTIVNVTRPDSPWVVSQTSSPHSRVSTEGVAVLDTFVFIPSYSETLWVYSVADPTAPYPIAGAPLGPGGWGYDADMLNDSTVIVGCKSYVKLVDVHDPAHPAVIGSCPTPNWVRRVVYASPYIYAACADAGVMILETTAVAVAEPKRASGWAGVGLHARPSPAGSRILVDFETVGIGPAEIAIIDMAGRIRLVRPAAGPQTAIEVSSLSPGVYAVTLRRDGLTMTGRFVKR